MKSTVLPAVAFLLGACGGTPTLPDSSSNALATCVYGAGVYGHGYVLQLGADRGDRGTKGSAKVKCGDAEVTFTESNPK